MKKQIVVIHGGNAFENYDEYLEHLKNKELTLERFATKGWKNNLNEELGNNYQVLNPQMPNAQNARYIEWKIWFEKLIPLLDEEIIFVGHSLGGIFLAKYLSENVYPKKIKATFLVAAPFNTKNQHPLVDFIITNDLSKFAKQSSLITIYHSKDDEIVPYSNVLDYKNALPNSVLHEFEHRRHFNEENFPELVAEIKKLK
jgi:uncharacterized protein